MAEERNGFAVIPAVDVVGVEAVRLRRGSFAEVVARAGDPEALVARYAEARPPLVHVVDLDGARSGAIRPELVARLADAATPVPIQASGGVRSLADAGALGERLAVAVDARAGKVAAHGWERDSDLSPEDLAERCAGAGVRRLLCTAIERDGTLAGPDLALLERVRDRFGPAVLAAGGIRSEDDLDALAALGLEGAVVGRALLEGAVHLRR